jgi:hypothetical protein
MALCLAIFLIPIIFFAGKLVGKFETIITRLGALEGKVDSFASGCFTITAATERMKEVDRERKVMWDHLDKMKKALLKLLQKSGFDVSQEDL